MSETVPDIKRTEAHIKAEALREAADEFQMNTWCDVLSGPFQTRIGNSQAVLDWLRARADSLEAGS